MTLLNDQRLINLTKMIKQFILSLIGGCIIGIAFSFFKLPLPAPPLPGLLGLGGMLLGSWLYQQMQGFFGS